MGHQALWWGMGWGLGRVGWVDSTRHGSSVCPLGGGQTIGWGVHTINRRWASAVSSPTGGHRAEGGNANVRVSGRPILGVRAPGEGIGGNPVMLRNHKISNFPKPTHEKLKQKCLQKGHYKNEKNWKIEFNSWNRSADCLEEARRKSTRS